MANIPGTPTKDRLVGGGADDVINYDPSAGNVGSADDDALYGNEGNDTLIGGNGNDILNGGVGDDMLSGGEGIDTADYTNGTVITTNTNTIHAFTGATAGVKVDLNVTGPQNTEGAGVDTLVGIENLTGTNMRDILTGDFDRNVLSGLDGDDELRSYGGDDRLDGGNGADFMWGWLGNETYVVDNIDDVVFDPDHIFPDAAAVSGGIETVESFISYTLGETIEHLTLIGTAAINGIGNARGNTIIGNSGNNVLAGLGGNDTLDGGNGNDTAQYSGATAGVTVSLANGAAQNTGGAGIDTLVLGTIENLTGSQFGDTLIGDANSNVLSGELGNDTLRGGLGNDTLNGGVGNDTASYSTATAGVTIHLTLAGAQDTGGAGKDILISIENLTGTNLNDTLTGDGTGNVLSGLGGNDILNGGAGNDTASYSTAASSVTVNLGLAGAQNTGGAGSDTLVLGTIENLTGSNFGDTLAGDANNNVLSGLAGSDILNGGLGNDRLDGGAGDDTMNGGRDNDTYVVNTSGDVVNDPDEIILGGVIVRGGIDTVETSVTYTLGFALEHLTLHQKAGAINGTGNYLDNTIIGNGADNILSGLDGNDTLRGGLGNDTLNGGNGADTATYSDATSSVTVNLANGAAQNTGGAGTDMLVLGTIENLVGSNFSDTLIGDANHNVLSGGGGNDTLNGGAGRDTASYSSATAGVMVNLANGAAQNTGGAGIDTLVLGTIENLEGSKFTDDFMGDGARNVLSGLGGNDHLSGAEGSDTLIGGAGSDALTGGTQFDTFDYNSVTESQAGVGNRDIITDFVGNGALAGDVIDLTGIDANTTTSLVNDPFTTYLDGGAFTGVVGQLRYAGGILQGDTNGDSMADFEIQLTGSPALVANDILL